MIFRLLKKITKNYGIFSALFFGIILSLVIINSNVIYGNVLKDSLFQKMIKNFEGKENTETAGSIMLYKGRISLGQGFSKDFNDKNKSKIKILKREIEEGRKIAQIDKSVFWYEETDMEVIMTFNKKFKLTAMKDFADHVDIVEGRMFKDSYIEEEKRITEVLVDWASVIDLNLELDKLYRMELVDMYGEYSVKTALEYADGRSTKTYIKVVGVYKHKENDVFWRKGMMRNDFNAFMITPNAMDSLCTFKAKPVNMINEYFLDFSDFRYGDYEGFAKSINIMRDSFRRDGYDVETNLNTLVTKESQNFKSVGNMLWIIQVPVLAILLLYVLMITGIIVDRDKDEIALLKSRGASRGKIIFNYLFDGVIILGGGLLVTPYLSLWAAKLMSRTNGFMEFNGVANNGVYLTRENVIFTIVTGVVFLGALIIPVVKATKEGVIDRKNSKVRIKDSAWKKTFIDFIFIGIGFYGLKMFMKSKEVAEQLSTNINKIALDPLVFLSATILAFGFSLLFLRIYPYAIKGIIRLFKKIMPANILVLFSNLSRKAGKREYVMIFIMIFISSSIFNLKIARTINNNAIDNLKYSVGAEVRMKGFWSRDTNGAKGLGDDCDECKTKQSISDVMNNTEKIEPDFSQYENLESLESVTKVMEIKNVKLNKGYFDLKNVNVMAIEPKAFGETAYMRRDLTPVHWYNYLNILAKEPRVVFMSKSIKSAGGNNLRIGDLINLTVYGFEESFIFGGYVDYWPGYKIRDKKLVIGNFNYFYSKIARVPYEVWGKLKSDKSENDLLREISKNSIKISQFDSISEFTKENIFLRAVNASITIAFILSIIVTLLGFLIYWCICIKERELQFGILRSLGMKKRNVYVMIFGEQILVTGTALVVGIKIGQYISSKFLNVIAELIFGNSMLLPILEYITSSDYLIIVTIFIVSIVFVLIIILKYISDIELGQAIKIGED